MKQSETSRSSSKKVIGFITYLRKAERLHHKHFRWSPHVADKQHLPTRILTHLLAMHVIFPNALHSIPDSIEPKQISV